MDKPWLIRTYSGYSSARVSNKLYRGNLAKGQTGLSVAFDLPTQTGYDSDHPLARGEVGKVGVPIGSISDMAVLFEDIPLEKMNTSMTINAPAAWLLALYVALAERRGIDPRLLKGTTQNDVTKEFLARGTFIFPPTHSMRLTGNVVAYATREIPGWNPMNVCSYHLQEAGATPAQEVGFTLATAVSVLDELRRQGLSDDEVRACFGRISFFTNAGIRFIEETCKHRAFTTMWSEIGKELGVTDPKSLLFRYGMQVNSLGLTEPQPENNAIRIALEMLGVVLSRDARARSIQLPAWNEALGLPRPWDQQWALRTQQVMAYETDVLEYGDIFEGSPVIARLTDTIISSARAEMKRVRELGGAGEAVEHMKAALVRSMADRRRRIESGDLKVVGVNCFQETEPSPLTANLDEAIYRPDRGAEREQIERLEAHRARRVEADVANALRQLVDAANSGANIMPASILCAHAGVTTGEWGDTLRQVFGEYRAPTGLGGVSTTAEPGDELASLRERVGKLESTLGHRPKVLIGKPGLDGHSNGAEQIAIGFRDAGFDVVYQGIRTTVEEIVASVIQEDVDVLGLSILSGSHMELVPEVLSELSGAGQDGTIVIVGGIIPQSDADSLLESGVSAVYTPKNFQIQAMVADVVKILEEISEL